MTVDISKVWGKIKLKKQGIELSGELKEKFRFNLFDRKTYKNYKTLMNTTIAAFIPTIGIIFSVPYAFNAWMANIQKKAGKIGIMKAIDEIDKPQLFVDSGSSPESSEEKTAKFNMYQTKLIPHSVVQ